MAKFIFTGTITVEGSAVRSKADAINTLQMMLDDFEDCNSDLDASVNIHWDKLARGKKED
jgi:hypothetical protein